MSPKFSVNLIDNFGWNGKCKFSGFRFPNHFLNLKFWWKPNSRLINFYLICLTFFFNFSIFVLMYLSDIELAFLSKLLSLQTKMCTLSPKHQPVFFQLLLFKLKLDTSPLNELNLKCPDYETMRREIYKIQWYPQRMRLQRLLYEVCFVFYPHS